MSLLTPNEFESNRRGEITAAQKQRLKSIPIWSPVFLLVIGVLFLGGIFAFVFSSFFISTSRFQWGILILFFFIGAIFLLFFLFIGRSLWNAWNTAVKIRRDQANRAIRQGQGQLSYGKKGYTFEVNDRALVLPPNGLGGLLPGVTYRVYYLEESRVLLSAEETHSPSPAQVQSTVNEILSTANGFSFEDLTANHNGEVTSAQRLKPLSKAGSGILFALMAFLFMIPFFFGAQSSRMPTESPGFLIFIGIALVFLVVGGFIVVNALVDVLFPTLQQAQGVGRKEIRVTGGRHRTTHYYYVIGGQRFEIRKGAYDAFIEGLQYRVYYLPRTKILLSIEALGAPSGGSPF